MNNEIYCLHIVLGAKEAAANNPIDKQETSRALKELADAVNSLLTLSAKSPTVSEYIFYCCYLPLHVFL
jgi:hypothetical protein